MDGIYGLFTPDHGPGLCELFAGLALPGLVRCTAPDLPLHSLIRDWSLRTRLASIHSHAFRVRTFHQPRSDWSAWIGDDEELAFAADLYRSVLFDLPARFQVSAHLKMTLPAGWEPPHGVVLRRWADQSGTFAKPVSGQTVWITTPERITTHLPDIAIPIRTLMVQIGASM